MRVCRPARFYLFFHPPRCPGAPPVERGEGPNSGPDWRESVGWKILLPLLGSVSWHGGFRAGREGRDSGPWISSRWGLGIFEVAVAPPVGGPSFRPSPREMRGEGEEAAPPRLEPPFLF